MEGPEHISGIPVLRRMITPNVPVCPGCLIERLRLTGRNSEVARCPVCIEKLTGEFTWVKCQECAEEWSYLGESKIEILRDKVQSCFIPDRNRVSETSICARCHDSRVGSAWAELKVLMIDEFKNSKKNKYRESFEND